MKAEDLLKEIRINNYVEFAAGIKEVDFALMEYLCERSYNWDGDLKPIELTEEWLIKMGFEKDHLYFSKGSFHYHMHGIVFIGNDHVSSGHVDSYLKTVHQLQNLYFALTGEELTIKN